jgi:hypothetical protein
MDVVVENATISGTIVNITKIEPNDIKAWDIVWPLHLSNRYNGNTPFAWDVLSHSFMVYQTYLKYDNNITKPNVIAMLLHDAAEAYIGDVVHPLKVIPDFKFFRELEEQIMKVVMNAFGFNYDDVDWDKVYYFDKVVTAIEFSKFFPNLIHKDKPSNMPVMEADDCVLHKVNVEGVINELEYLTQYVISDTDRKRLFHMPEILKEYIDK